jgi:AcrR family transcriptional regulator
MGRDQMAVRDRRVKRTENLLAKALIALSLEKGYEAVTIRDLTERADVGYATFFRHYHDKDELLAEVVEVVLDELLVRLPSSPDADPAEVGRILFQYVAEHAEVIRVLLVSNGPSSLLKNVIDTGTQSVLSQHVPLEDGIVPPEVAAHHLVMSTITLIQWWLDHDMPYSPERMGLMYQELIARPAAVAFQR